MRSAYLAMTATLLALGVAIYLLAADRRVLLEGEDAWRAYAASQGWRQFRDVPDPDHAGQTNRVWSDWWLHLGTYRLEPKAHLSFAGVCRYTGYHVTTPEGDYLTGGRVCGHPFGALRVERVNENSSCQPGARDWPVDEEASFAAADLICAGMAAYAGDTSPFRAAE